MSTQIRMTHPDYGDCEVHAMYRDFWMIRTSTGIKCVPPGQVEVRNRDEKISESKTPPTPAVLINQLQTWQELAARFPQIGKLKCKSLFTHRPYKDFAEFRQKNAQAFEDESIWRDLSEHLDFTAVPTNAQA